MEACVSLVNTWLFLYSFLYSQRTNTPRKQGGLGSMKIPLVADTRRTISTDYGVLKDDEGIAYRYVLQCGVMLFHYESKKVTNNEACLLGLLLLNISLKVPPCISGSEGRIQTVVPALLFFLTFVACVLISPKHHITRNAPSCMILLQGKCLNGGVGLVYSSLNLVSLLSPQHSWQIWSGCKYLIVGFWKVPETLDTFNHLTCSLNGV